MPNAMTRATVCYWSSLSIALGLFASVFLGAGSPDSVLRLLLCTMAAASAAAAWGSAIVIASVRRTVWPLATLTFLVVASVATFALARGPS
jgi:hypothetical protein